MSFLKNEMIAASAISLLSASGFAADLWTDIGAIPLVGPSESSEQTAALNGVPVMFANEIGIPLCKAVLRHSLDLTVTGTSEPYGDEFGPILLMPYLETSGHTLTVRLAGAEPHPEFPWPFVAALAVNAAGQPNIRITASGGTMTFWGGGSAGSTNEFISQTVSARNADARARLALQAMDRLPEDVLVLGSPLTVTAESRISIGATDEEAARNANFTLGSRGAVVVDSRLLDGRPGGREAETPNSALIVQSGASVYFGQGATIVIDSLSESLEAALEETEPLSAVLIRMAGDGRVVGAQNLTVVDIRSGTAFEYRLVFEDGNWGLGQRFWEAEGPLAAPANALAARVFEGTASEPLRALFMGSASAANFSERVIHSTLTAKSLGTTEAMDALMAEGARHAVRTALADEWSNPVSVEILGTKRRGGFAALDAKTGGIGSGRWERSASGVALSADARFGSWFAGARAAYEDADVDFRCEGWRDASGLKAESTVLSAGLWLGRRTSWGFVTADAAFSGGEDKVREAAPQVVTGYPLWVGSERIRRRAWSAGLTAALLPEAAEGWTPALTFGLSAQYFMPADYSIDGNGTALWQVGEKRRLVTSASVSAGVTKRWSDEAVKNTVRLTLEGGMRMRAGDLEATQTVSAYGASADLTTDDLERGEAFLTADVTGRWRGSVFGVRGTGTAGPSGTRALRGDVHVTYEF